MVAELKIASARALRGSELGGLADGCMNTRTTMEVGKSRRVLSSMMRACTHLNVGGRRRS
eukprot:6212743-Pleurochrysis_carterae.AAC.8